jgi:hypothetical protein
MLIRDLEVPWLGRVEEFLKAQCLVFPLNKVLIDIELGWVSRFGFQGAKELYTSACEPEISTWITTHKGGGLGLTTSPRSFNMGWNWSRLEIIGIKNKTKTNQGFKKKFTSESPRPRWKPKLKSRKHFNIILTPFKYGCLIWQGWWVFPLTFASSNLFALDLYSYRWILFF